MRRPLFPVAIAGLVGTVMGLIIAPHPLLGVGFAFSFGILSWWGPKMWRTPTIWLFALAVFNLYAGARAFAPSADSLRARAGEKGGTVQVEGWVAELPTRRVWDGGGEALEAELEVVRLQGQSGWERTRGRVLMRVDPAPEKIPQVGEIVRVVGYLALPVEPRNPGEFNRVRHLRSRGLDYILRTRPEDLEWTGGAEVAGWARMAAGLRAHMLQATALGLEDDPEAAGLIAAMLFGYRDGVGEELRESFRATGTLHLFAVSGQNLAVVAGMLLWILALTGAVRWRWAWVTLPMVFLFCLATGMEASAARAFIMTTVLYLGWIMGRPMDPANWLGAALLALLIWDPRQVADTGFQLSFLVVAGLMVMAGPLQARLIAWGRPDLWIPSRLVAPWRRAGQRVWVAVATVAAASAAAWVGSLVPGILLFHQIIPVALLANVVAAPVAGAATVLAAVSSVVAPIAGGVVAVGVNLVNGKQVHFLAAILGWMATWPGGHFAVADPRVWFQSGPAVEILSVEGAAPTLISGRDGRWLVDPGSKIAWANSVRPFLNWSGVNGLEGVVLTAGLSNRSGGAEELRMAMPVGWWAESGLGGKSGFIKQWRKEMAEDKVGRRYWRAGDEVDLGAEWKVKVLWPPVGGGSGRSEEEGIVFRLDCGKARLLWAGTISAEGEKELVRLYGSDLEAGVLVQGPAKEGAMNLTREWLQMIQPKTLIRSAKPMQDDPSLSVDMNQLAGVLGMEVVQLKKSGAVRLQPDRAMGTWRWEGMPK